MMHKLIFVALFASLALAELTAEQKQKLEEHHKICHEQSGVNDDLVQKAKQGSFQEDAKLKDYVFCVLKRIGFINDKGEIQKDVLVLKTTAGLGDKDLALKLAGECGVAQSSPLETAWKLASCYYEKSPNHVSPII